MARINGFLSPDALRSGFTDQWAADVDHVRHKLTISYDRTRGGFVLDYETNDGSSSSTVVSWQVGDQLRIAQDKFREIARPLGGSV